MEKERETVRKRARGGVRKGAERKKEREREGVCMCLKERAYTPPKTFLGGGFSTPYTPFCLICTIN